MRAVSRNILVVGVADKGDALRELPVQVLSMDIGAQAIRCLKEEKIDTIVSQWELIDIPDGNFLKNVIKAKPSMPTIAFITPGNINQEIAARQIGVDCVLSGDIDDGYFREAVCQILKISAEASMQIASDYSDIHCNNIKKPEKSINLFPPPPLGLVGDQLAGPSTRVNVA